MTYHFITGKHSMLKAWKELRSSLESNLDDVSHLKLVTNFWSLAPLAKHVTDWDQPHLWEDPWQLVYNGNFDESTIAIAMFYSLLLANDGRWSKNRLQLLLVKDQARALQRLILAVDDRWILNLEHNRVIDKSQVDLNLWIQRKYEYDGKHHNISA